MKSGDKNTSPGIYERVLTSDLESHLQAILDGLELEKTQDDLDSRSRLALLRLLTQEISSQLSSISKADEATALANKVLSSLVADNEVTRPLQLLTAIRDTSKPTSEYLRPHFHLNENALLSNDKNQPNLSKELIAELSTADKVDMIVSFVKTTGVALLADAFRNLRDRKVPVRLITTTYIGATDFFALQRLCNEFGVEIKVDYDGDIERLHAKAWIIHRDSGYSTAFVGSSNVSRPAMLSGKEWNVRISSAASRELFQKLASTFDIYWNSESFSSFDPSRDKARFDAAVGIARGTKGEEISGLEVTPRAHQIRMLEELDYARQFLNTHRNLVVAATGTGKTVLSALDYKNVCDLHGRRLPLLFIAHRKELLKQSLRTFREVLKDKNFGELFVDGEKPDDWNFVFASVQSMSRPETLNRVGAYDFIIIDEFHHAEAKSYRKLIDASSPIELVGLTATPERSDGSRVQDSFFEGKITSELRLWNALDLDLLTPFTYFGIGDELDLSQVAWKAGRYDQDELSNVINAAAHWRNNQILREMVEKLGDLTSRRALAFCVNVEHAKSFSSYLNSKGVAAAYLVGSSSDEDRKILPQKLINHDINVLCVVDLFNEGVDLPAVDTLIMLRPTESPVVFLQQLGRGLRKFEGKAETVVLDFVMSHRVEYRTDLKYSALLGISRSELKNEVEKNFPNLPSGCSLSLDKLAAEHILDNLRIQIDKSSRSLTREIRATGTFSLVEFLERSDFELGDVLGKSSKRWFKWLEAAGLRSPKAASSRFASQAKNFRFSSDPTRQSAYRALLSGEKLLSQDCDEETRKLVSMFIWNSLPRQHSEIKKFLSYKSPEQVLTEIISDEDFVFETLQILEYAKSKTEFFKEYAAVNSETPLRIHARYTRAELLAALDYPFANQRQDFFDWNVKKSPSNQQEGAQWFPELGLDLLFVTIGKKSPQSSPSDYFEDYSINRQQFHWESQKQRSIESSIGQRFLSQATTENRMLLCVREYDANQIGANGFVLLGRAQASEVSGERPIRMTLNLEHSMPAEFYQATCVNLVA